MLTVLHYDVDFSIIDERVVVAHDEVGVKLRKQLNLLHGFECRIRRQVRSVYLFDYVVPIHDESSLDLSCHVDPSLSVELCLVLFRQLIERNSGASTADDGSSETFDLVNSPVGSLS